jgi:hypothetical protein
VLEVLLHLLNAPRLAELVDVAQVFVRGLESLHRLEEQIHAHDAVLIQVDVNQRFLSNRQPYFLWTVDSEGSLQDWFGKSGNIVVAEEFVVEYDEFTKILAKLFNFLEDWLILQLPMLMQFQNGQVVEAPDVESEV